VERKGFLKHSRNETLPRKTRKIVFLTGRQNRSNEKIHGPGPMFLLEWISGHLLLKKRNTMLASIVDIQLLNGLRAGAGQPGSRAPGKTSRIPMGPSKKPFFIGSPSGL
jgi:hypothetical protein